MTIKFIPEDKNVKLEGQKEYEAMVLGLLRCAINKLNRVELQLEKLTGDEIDCDDGDKL